MNKIPIFFLLFLVTSMVFVTTPITVHADSQLDILIKISLNTKEHIKTDIEKAADISKEAYLQFDEGVKETDLLIEAAEAGDVVSARQHFISAMVAFKKVSIATETVADKSQQSLTPDRSQTIEKYENNIIKLKEISDKLNAGVDFEQIDQLLDLAKNNYAQGSFVQNEKVLSQIASEGREIHKLLYEISEQSKIYRAQHFAKKQAERITDLILEAKQIGLHQTAIDLEESKVQLLQANSTQVIKQQFKIIIIHKQKVDNAKDLQQAKFLKFKAILDSLENKAKKLASDVEVNSGAEYFLKKAFSLIEDVRMDIKDLEYAPTMMRDDSKYVDLTIGSKIKTIKDILVKVERLAYTSS
jgi:hypothetical protein